MSLNERLTEDMKAAMKAGPAGKVRLDTIRFLKAALKNVEIDKKGPLTDEDVLGVVTKQVKQLKDSIEEFEKADRTDLSDKAKAEVEVLSGYLPTQMSADEVRELARQIVAEVGAQGPKDMGKVMGPLVARTKGRADGKLVQQIVKELLG
ncbi:MAG: hypothetical protein K0R39_447 [Symbiobacteriaceae bacterium]|jgi:uncharacterized protein YqeY|nr:hypothetical protein [Symbiobacteriaceae bacterium]